MPAKVLAWYWVSSKSERGTPAGDQATPSHFEPVSKCMNRRSLDGRGHPRETDTAYTAETRTWTVVRRLFPRTCTPACIVEAGSHVPLPRNLRS
jgi:hypothetical protein